MDNDTIRFLNEFCYSDDFHPTPKMTLWSAVKPLSFKANWFTSSDDLLEYMDEEIKKRESYLDDTINNSADYISSLLPGIFRYDYLGSFLGEDMVFKKSHLVYTENGLVSNFVSFEALSLEKRIPKILRETESGYIWQEYVRVRSLEEVYEEFEYNGAFDSSKVLSLGTK